MDVDTKRVESKDECEGEYIILGCDEVHCMINDCAKDSFGLENHPELFECCQDHDARVDALFNKEFTNVDDCESASRFLTLNGLDCSSDLTEMSYLFMPDAQDYGLASLDKICCETCILFFFKFISQGVQTLRRPPNSGISPNYTLLISVIRWG